MIDNLWNDHSFRVLLSDLLKTKTKGEDEQKMRLEILVNYINSKGSEEKKSPELKPVEPPKPVLVEEDERKIKEEQVREKLRELKKMPYVAGKPRVIRIPLIAQSRLNVLWHEEGLNHGPEPEFLAVEDKWQITLR